jgi:DNA-binding Lrp family transcriptional regulator
MSKEYDNLTDRILRLLERDLGQQIQQLVKVLKANRTFFVGYLRALENEGKIKSRGLDLQKCIST